MTRRVVPVDQSLAGRAIEQAGRRELLLGAGVRGLSLLERSPQGGTLRTVAHGRRARLTHVLLGGSDIRHRQSRKKEIIRGVRELALRAVEPRFAAGESQAP